MNVRLNVLEFVGHKLGGFVENVDSRRLLRHRRFGFLFDFLNENTRDLDLVLGR